MPLPANHAFKVLNENGQSCNGGNAQWFLPKGDRPGKWMPETKGELVPCINGYHLCRPADLIEWLGPRIWLAEYRGGVATSDNKIVVRQARLIKRLPWDDSIARHFAADCAYRSLSIYEKQYPDDKRPRECIEVVRRYADGQATDEELAAAWDAAWAARDAARAAAWAAERKWQIAHLMKILGV